MNGATSRFYSWIVAIVLVVIIAVISVLQYQVLRIRGVK